MVNITLKETLSGFFERSIVDQYLLIRHPTETGSKNSNSYRFKVTMK